jgi:hypothetical protein
MSASMDTSSQSTIHAQPTNQVPTPFGLTYRNSPDAIADQGRSQHKENPDAELAMLFSTQTRVMSSTTPVVQIPPTNVAPGFYATSDDTHAQAAALLSLGRQTSAPAMTSVRHLEEGRVRATSLPQPATQIPSRKASAQIDAAIEEEFEDVEDDEDTSAQGDTATLAKRSKQPTTFPDIDALVVCIDCTRLGFEGHNRAMIKNFKAFGITVQAHMLCDVCGGRLDGQNKPWVPSSTKSASGRYKCYRCNSQFFRSDRLLAHSHFHTHKKAFPCPGCPAQFCRKHRLLDHMKMCKPATLKFK